MPTILDEIAVQLSLDAGQYSNGAQRAVQDSRALSTALNNGAAAANTMQQAATKLGTNWSSTASSMAAGDRKFFGEALKAAGGDLKKAAIALDDYRRGATQATAETNKLGASQNAAANDARKFATGQRAAADAASKVAQNIGGLVGQVAALGAGVAIAVVGVNYFFNSLRQGVENLKRLGSFIFTTNRAFQALDAQLRTSLGSAEAARGAFSLIEDFATTTPFKVESLTEAFANLSQFGFVPLRDELTGLGNIAAARGKDITDLTGAIVAGVNTSVEPLRQFGITAKISGDKMIVSFDGVKETIDRSIPALAEYAARQGLVGDNAAAMSNQLDTLDGSLNGAANAAGEFARRVGNQGLNKELVEVIQSITEMIEKSDTLAAAVGSFASEAINTFRGALEKVQPVLSGTIALMDLMSRTNPFTAAVGNRIEEFVDRARDAGERARKIRESTTNIGSMTSLPQVRGLQSDLRKQIAELSIPFATSSADRSRLPALAAQLEAAGEQAALLQAKADSAGRTLTNFGTSTKTATDEVQKIREAFEQGRREIAAMEAATAGTSIEFDAAAESAQLFERTIRALGATGREDALAMLQALVPEWEKYVDALDAAEAATKRQQAAMKQLAASQAIAADNIRKHEEDVAEFKARQFEIAHGLAEAEREQMRDVAEDIATHFTDAFNEMIQGTKSVGEAFRNMASQIIADIQRILIQRSIIQPLVNALFPAAGTDFLNHLKSGEAMIDLGGPGGGLPHFAHGGPIARGQAAIVGEEGPELFIPASAGRIAPNVSAGGGRVTEIIELHAPMSFSFPGVNAREATQLAQRMAPELAGLVSREVEKRLALRRRFQK